MARKVSPEQLVLVDDEIGVRRGEQFKTLLNFDFEILKKVSMGQLSGRGAVYSIKVHRTEPK